MAAVIICSDFGAPQNSLTLFPLFPHLFPMKWWDQMPWSSFSECWALSQLFHSHFHYINRSFHIYHLANIFMKQFNIFPEDLTMVYTAGFLWLLLSFIFLQPHGPPCSSSTLSSLFPFKAFTLIPLPGILPQIPFWLASSLYWDVCSSDSSSKGPFWPPYPREGHPSFSPLHCFS